MASHRALAPYRAIIVQRLTAAAEVLDPGTVDPGSVDSGTVDSGTVDSGGDLAALLQRLSESVRLDPSDGRLWLLFTAVAGAYPTPAQFQAVRRAMELATPGSASNVMLDGTQEAAAAAGEWTRPLRIVRQRVVADVNFCAKFVHNTGIQRVVREVMPHIVKLGGDRLELVAWSRRSGVTQSLTAVERQRVVDWRAVSAGTSRLEPVGPEELIVPWQSHVLLPEVPEPTLCERLAALAQYSGNTVAVIGYDTIPIVSADLVLSSESERFARYLTIIKHVDEVVAISESVASEFEGFARSLESQGLVGPRVTAVSLASDVPALEDGARPLDSAPLVLAVGSHEPRKNQDAVLFAVETLLDEGLDFRVTFVGGGNRRRTLAFDRHLRALRDKRGWKIEAVRGMKDRELWQSYRDARFTAFISLHEGYGLPVVESLALGTPVLTTDYGSLAEIAAGGGCVTVDPRSDDEIVTAMRRMLTDDALIASLEKAARGRAPRSWADYAAELWSAAGLGVSK